MKLQQLRYLHEVAKRGLNLSEAALALHTSQPGISKQVRLLEEELGVQILVRNGKRVVDVTEPGRIILDIAARILRDTGQKKAALQAYKQILKINPYQEGAKEAVDELSVEVEGQDI